ncbi:non-ribosomal peptide synthetase [Colletotrichum higginsianum]|nr:non-ribosomal peptide synthetase [Colletotrichum higginsianum]
MFTYAGSVQQLEREKGVLEQLTIPGRLWSTEAADIGPDVPRIALFEVSAMVDRGAASVQVVYNRHSRHQDRIAEWIQTYEHLLYEAIGRLRYRGQELTLSDVPMLNTTYEGLAKLNTDRLVALGLSSARDIEDVLPVTALQQEILISQTRDMETCHSHAVYELASANGVVADQAQICGIWQHIVARYPALRTVFIDSISEDGLFDQVVLRRCSPDMLFVDAEGGEDPVAVLNALPPMSASPSSPRHRVSVCKSHASTFLRLDISHALCDALSLQNIVWDLKRMYNNNSNSISSNNSSSGSKVSSSSMKMLDPSHAACVRRSVLMQMAWALVLRAFTGSHRVCFGYRSSGREAEDAPEGLTRSVGTFENTTACSVGLENHKTVGSVLKTIQDDVETCRPHQHVPISEIQHALSLQGQHQRQQHHQRDDGLLFNTCLSYQEEPHELKSRFSSTARPPMRLSCIQAFNTPDMDVTLSLTLVNGRLVTGVSHRLMTAAQAENLTNTFGRAVLSLLEAGPDAAVGADYAQLLISDWGADKGGKEAASPGCVHALVSQHARLRPDAQAICAWDGELSYRQVCRLVSRLATFLGQWGVRPGVAVVVATDMMWKHLEAVVDGVVVVDDSLFEVNFAMEAPLPMAAPNDAACILLSPGSSRGREAKGIVFPHAALSSAFVTQGRALGLDGDSRVMQLSSFCVDTALVELLSTLVHGGCVCVPSSVERTSDIVGAARRMDVNWSYMTPVLARKMTPAAIPSLRTVCFRTRRLDGDTCGPWMAATRVLLAYGAPDVCPLGVSVLEVARPSDLTRVAPPFLGRFWIVNPEDHRKLMPIGAVGELVIESPTLAHRFVPGQPLCCLPQGADLALEDGKPRTRYFKTGHRSIISRDAQPSLAAFVELGERLFEGSEDLTRISVTNRERTYIAKKLIESSLGTSLPSHMMPTVFVPVKHLPVTPSLKVNRRKLQKMVGWLSQDQLVALSAVASPDEIRSVGIKPLPLTKVEERMRSVWASVLGVEAEAIHGNQSFVMLGGRSYLAGRLVVACRKRGLIIALPDVLRGASLTELCQGITLSSDYALEAAAELSTETSAAPSSASASASGASAPASASASASSPEMPFEEHFVRDVIAPKLKVAREAICDVAEASATQLRFLETGLLKGNASLTYFTFSFTGAVQTKKLEAVCLCLAKIHPILRTAFVVHERRVYQAALKSFVPEFKRVEVPTWRVSAMTEKLIKRDQTGSFNLEVPATKFFFVDAGKQSNLVLRLSGAQYDDASVSLLLQHLRSIYVSPSCPPRRATYFDFARSATNNNTITTTAAAAAAAAGSAKDHWASVLDGAKMTRVVAHSKPPAMSANVKTISQRVSVMSLANIGISFDTVVKSAWAMVLGNLAGSGDVLFGEVVEGRHLRLPDGSDVSGTLGPVSNAIPVRVRFADTLSSPLELLKHVHGQRVASIPFENMGWLDVVEKCTKMPYWTRFSTVVEHRHQDAAREAAAVFNLGGAVKCRFSVHEAASRDVYDLHVVSAQETAAAGDISLTFCENRIPAMFAADALRALCANIELLTSVSMLHPLIPSAADYRDVPPQIPLPRLEMETKPTTAAGAAMSGTHRAAVQAAISRVWTAALDPRSLGVPEAQLHNAAFYDLWGSMVPAFQLAEMLTQELPRLGLPGSHHLTVSMEEQQQQQGGAPFMDSIAEGAISGGIRAARPASPVELDGPRRQRLSLAVEHDGSSMESLTTGSSRTDEETEDRRPSVPGNGEDREEEDADVVSPLSATTTTAPTPVKESRIRRKAGSVLSRISLVSPVSLSGSKLGHR